MIRFPGPGCIVEFMQGNRAQQALVLEEHSGVVRLYTLSRRETKLPVSRLLPWFGPTNALPDSRQAMQSLLEETRRLRETLLLEIDPIALWEMASGEVEHAPVDWFAELLCQNPDCHQIAATGQALLECKTHFKFNPPNFELLSEEKVAGRLEELEAARKREELLGPGRTFLQALWENHLKNGQGKQPLPEISPDLAAKLEEILRRRLADPEDHETASIWKELSKPLPGTEIHLPLLLLQAWGVLPEHHNFLLDRIDYPRNLDWAEPFKEDIAKIIQNSAAEELELVDLPFFSIDDTDTKDLDDAFYLAQTPDGGFELTLAIACPACAWEFGTAFDKAVLKRASSIYLPEGDLHMLPLELGLETYSLTAGKIRPALLNHFTINAEGEVTDLKLRLARIKVAANLTFEDCETLLEQTENTADPATSCAAAKDNSNPASPYASGLCLALRLAQKRQALRLAKGAVIIKRPEPRLVLTRQANSDQLVVSLKAENNFERSQLLVGEIMVLLNSSIADLAIEKNVPLIYRTQDVVVPKDYSGVWEAPQDIAKVVKVLPPAALAAKPRPHAGLGLAAYATLTSPLRRYIDLFNQAQIVSLLRIGAPLFDQNQLEGLLPLLAVRAEAASLVQKQRPRYWKLLFFKQQKDKRWYDAVITEENDIFVTLFLPNEQMQLRNRYNGEKFIPGQLCRVRVGKVNPLYNEIQVLDLQEY